MFLRLWTHGWDCFASPVPIAFHYKPESLIRDRPIANKYNVSLQKSEQETRAAGFARLLHILGIAVSSDPPLDAEKYGLGTVRTVDQFEAFFGFSFRRQCILDPSRGHKEPFVGILLSR